MPSIKILVFIFSLFALSKYFLIFQKTGCVYTFHGYAKAKLSCLEMSVLYIFPDHHLFPYCSKRVILWKAPPICALLPQKMISTSSLQKMQSWFCLLHIFQTLPKSVPPGPLEHFLAIFSEIFPKSCR